MYMVTIAHQGTEPDDRVEIEASSHEEALNKLLEIRQITNIAALEPAIIETKWC